MNRWALAIILGYVAAFGLPKASSPAVPTPSIPTPSTAMRDAVRDVTLAMASASAADRALFADLWLRASDVVEADNQGDAIFGDTRTLREFARITATIGWNRLGGNQPGKVRGLDAACDKAFASTVGMDPKTADSKVRETFAALCDALAWAALQR